MCPTAVMLFSILAKASVQNERLVEKTVCQHRTWSARVDQSITIYLRYLIKNMETARVLKRKACIGILVDWAASINPFEHMSTKTAKLNSNSKISLI